MKGTLSHWIMLLFLIGGQTPKGPYCIRSFSSSLMGVYGSPMNGIWENNEHLHACSDGND